VIKRPRGSGYRQVTLDNQRPESPVRFTREPLNFPVAQATDFSIRGSRSLVNYSDAMQIMGRLSIRESRRVRLPAWIWFAPDRSLDHFSSDRSRYFALASESLRGSLGLGGPNPAFVSTYDNVA